MRALGQVGKVQGDITCPARVAGIADPWQIPMTAGRLRGHLYDELLRRRRDARAGMPATGSGMRARASSGRGLRCRSMPWSRTTRDRSRLTSDGNLPWLTIGVRHGFDPRWSVAVELLYVPLDVRRPPDFSPCATTRSPACVRSCAIPSIDDGRIRSISTRRRSVVRDSRGVQPHASCQDETPVWRRGTCVRCLVHTFRLLTIRPMGLGRGQR